MKFVFEAKLKIGCTEEQYTDAWQKGSQIIQQQPGAKGTELHRKIGEDNVFLAIANWESKEARDKAMSALKEMDSETQQILSRHEQFADINIIGAFEDAEWRAGNT